MSRIDIAKIRIGLEGMRALFAEGSGFPQEFDKLLALLPPKPEVPKGPYKVTTGPLDSWCIVDAHGHHVAEGIPDEPTAQLLASSWQLRRDLETAEGLLRRIRGRIVVTGALPVTAADIDRYFEDNEASTHD